MGCLIAASKTVEVCLQKINESRELELKDPPIEDYAEKILSKNKDIVSSIDLKIKLQNGKLNPDAWKKKLDEF